MEKWPATVDMEYSRISQYYILLGDWTWITNEIFPKGSIWISCIREENGEEILKRGGHDREIAWQSCPKEHLCKLEKLDYELLLAVKKDADRFIIYQDPSWLAEGRELHIGDEVKLVNAEQFPDAYGHIKFKGHTDAAKEKGILFGIELVLEFSGLGSSNGTFMRTKFFECEDNRAVFLSLKFIRRKMSNMSYIDNKNFDSPDMSREAHASREFDETVEHAAGLLSNTDVRSKVNITSSETAFSAKPSNIDEPHPASNMASTISSLSISLRSDAVNDQAHEHQPIKVGERVIWLNDTIPEGGIVRWVNEIPGLDPSHKLYAGIEFDNPIGKGTGRYKGIQLFNAKKGHASLVPVVGLIRPSDIHSEADSNINLRTGTSNALSDISEPGCMAFGSGGPRADAHRSPVYIGRGYSGNSSKTEALEPDIQEHQSQQRPRSIVPPLQKSDLTRLGKEVVRSQSQPTPKADAMSGVVTDVPSDGVPCKVDDRVQVPPYHLQRLGTIRWLGTVDETTNTLAGVELDIPDPSCCTDGTFQDRRLFHCSPHRAFFIFVKKLKPAP